MNKMNSLERTKRLLAVLPWIESQNGPFLDEVARRFDYPEEELVEDLENVVFFCWRLPIHTRLSYRSIHFGRQGVGSLCRLVQKTNEINGS